MIDLDQIKKQLEEISPWPWKAKLDEQAKSWHELWSNGSPGMDIARLPPWSTHVEANAAFIAQAPSLVAALVKEVERLSAVIEHHKNAVHELTIEFIEELKKNDAANAEIERLKKELENKNV